MPVTDQLARLIVCGRKSQTHDNIVQTAFELGEQVFTGDALLPRRFLEIRAELVLEYAVDSLDLLLLAQLQSITDNFRPPGMSVLAGLKISLLDGAGRLEATFSLEKQIHLLAAAKTTYRTRVSSQCNLLRFSNLTFSHTLRRFGGRHPLCGIGVASRIERISMPAVCSARIAESRPDPGPLTFTSSDRIPTSRARLAAVTAACWAANGVPLRDPLKPS